MNKLSRNALKRIARAWEYEDQYSARAEGARDAVKDARRALRAGKVPPFYVDGPDYFGTYLDDSVTGHRYIRSHDYVTKMIRRRVTR